MGPEQPRSASVHHCRGLERIIASSSELPRCQRAQNAHVCSLNTIARTQSTEQMNQDHRMHRCVDQSRDVAHKDRCLAYLTRIAPHCGAYNVWDGRSDRGSSAKRSGHLHGRVHGQSRIHHSNARHPITKAPLEAHLDDALHTEMRWKADDPGALRCCVDTTSAAAFRAGRRACHVAASHIGCICTSRIFLGGGGGVPPLSCHALASASRALAFAFLHSSRVGCCVSSLVGRRE
mmetsp:Transcript_10329/g.32779  ORF Transcript_10329/g.32779 Transcript_10329/m.32779 type:complete len:234 (-) Transcript_10329:29-730(-)